MIYFIEKRDNRRHFFQHFGDNDSKECADIETGGKTRASTDENDGVDLFKTPPDTTHELLDVLQLAEGTLMFEPCAGNAAITNVLRERCLEVVERNLHTMCRDGTHKEEYDGKPEGHNFLEEELPDSNEASITNPPYEKVSYIYILIYNNAAFCLQQNQKFLKNC